MTGLRFSGSVTRVSIEEDKYGCWRVLKRYSNGTFTEIQKLARREDALEWRRQYLAGNMN